jgi:radical SAM protein (TIGR01212 family)
MIGVLCEVVNASCIYHSERMYRTYSSYLKDRYNKPVYRVAVDAGFSCPNRFADRTQGGCSFCQGDGSAARYTDGRQDIVQQVRNSTSFLKKRYGAHDYILYLQSYSNTYKPPAELKKLYQSILDLEDFREFVVGTRSDCINEQVAELLSNIKEGQGSGMDVWVELGLQTIHNRTLNRINRGEGYEDFLKAFSILRERGIKIAVHLIFGLPGEDWVQIEQTVRAIAALKPEGVKFHNLHIPKGTAMYKDVMLSGLSLPGPHRYLSYVIHALELLPRDTVILRINSDTPRDRRALPRRFWKKGSFQSALVSEMARQGSYQGRLFVDG